MNFIRNNKNQLLITLVLAVLWSFFALKAPQAFLSGSIYMSICIILALEAKELRCPVVLSLKRTPIARITSAFMSVSLAAVAQDCYCLTLEKIEVRVAVVINFCCHSCNTPSARFGAD